MSRSAAKKKNHQPAISAPPPIVQKVQQAMLEERRARLYAFCRDAAWNGKFPVWRHGEALGANIADHVLLQMMQRMRERDSRIIVPAAGMLVAQPSPGEART